MNSPLNFKTILKKIGNYKHAQATLSKFLSFRIGIEVETVKCEEFRFDIYTWENIPNLYKVLQIYKNEFDDSYNYGYGMHMHVDAAEINKLKQFNPENFPHTLLLKLLEVFDYKGKFNAHKVSWNKTAIKYHREYTSVEYRFLPIMTDFKKLFKSMLILSACNRYLRIADEKKHSLDDLFGLIDTFLKM